MKTIIIIKTKTITTINIISNTLGWLLSFSFSLSLLLGGGVGGPGSSFSSEFEFVLTLISIEDSFKLFPDIKLKDILHICCSLSHILIISFDFIKIVSFFIIF